MKKLGCVKLFSDFKEGKRCPSESRSTTFKSNAGMSRIGLKKMCDLREMHESPIALPRIDTDESKIPPK